MISITDAQNLINGFSKNFGTESVSIEYCLNRVLAEDVYADRDYPPFNRSAMDGYAIRSQDFLNHIQTYEIIEELHAGNVSSKKIESGQAIKIMTGASVPHGADVVIKREEAIQEGKLVTFQIEKINAWQNIARKGEDVKHQELVIPKGEKINYGLVSVLASLGKASVEVKKIPKIGIISTGNEIKQVSEPVLPHQIRDSNSYTSSMFLKSFGIDIQFKKHVRDDWNELLIAVKESLHLDILILSGGVSAGDADLVPAAMKECGIKEVFHKVKIRPGKPLWFGSSEKGLSVFAMPGNPFSVQVACKIFLEPYLRTCLGMKKTEPLILPLSTGRKKKIQLDEFFPCKIENGNLLSPSAINGSGDITVMLDSDGIALHESSLEDLEQNQQVKFFFW